MLQYRDSLPKDLNTIYDIISKTILQWFGKRNKPNMKQEVFSQNGTKRNNIDNSFPKNYQTCYHHYHHA
jgi:hypothetical protein